MTTVIFDLSLLILTLSPRTPARATKQEIGIAKKKEGRSGAAAQFSLHFESRRIAARLSARLCATALQPAGG